LIWSRPRCEDADGFEDAVTRVVGVYCQAADEDPALFEYHLIHMFRFGRTDRDGRPDPVTLIAEAIARAMDARGLPARRPRAEGRHGAGSGAATRRPPHGRTH
jgi:hypothetical protein